MKTLNRKQKRQAVKMTKREARLNLATEIKEFNIHLGSNLLDEILERRRQTV